MFLFDDYHLGRRNPPDISRKFNAETGKRQLAERGGSGSNRITRYIVPGRERMISICHETIPQHRITRLTQRRG